MEKRSETGSMPQLEEDRISKLPDDILVDILSSIKNIKEAAHTSVLSHRWLNLWTHVPLLHFDATKEQRYICQAERSKWTKERPVFANWVNHVLDSHKSSNLQEFRIFFDLDKSYQSEIDKWLEYALDMRLEKLELDLSPLCFLGIAVENSCSFPNQLLDKTTQVGVRISAKVGFSYLKVLCFTAVKITGEAIEQLLLMCPLLEDLRVIGSSVLINLVVSGPSLLLKHLEITTCCHVESITISNINIVFLKIFTSDNKVLLLNNLPMLIEVQIKGNPTSTSTLFSKLSCLLPQLTVLTIHFVCPERCLGPVSILDLYKLPKLHNLRRLVLSGISCGDKCLIGLTISLIDFCPRLVEFALQMYPFDRLILDHYREHINATEQSLKNLKVFELHGYHGNTKEKELLMFFIKNAAALEKVVIVPHCKRTRIHGVERIEAEQANDSRRHAIANFEGVVPEHVALVIR